MDLKIGMYGFLTVFCLYTVFRAALVMEESRHVVSESLSSLWRGAGETIMAFASHSSPWKLERNLVMLSFALKRIPPLRRGNSMTFDLGVALRF